MGRPRKWPGETQAERTNAYHRDLYRRQNEGKPDKRPKSKYPGDTPAARDRARKDAWDAAHRDEKRAWNAEYRKRPEAMELARARGTRYRARLSPEQVWERNLRVRYGLTAADYERMHAEQGGLCAICGRPPEDGKRLQVDHHHMSGQVRALLCIPCNLLIGYSQESTGILATAIAYLRRHGGDGGGDDYVYPPRISPS